VCCSGDTTAAENAAPHDRNPCDILFGTGISLSACVRILTGPRVELLDPFPQEHLDLAFAWTKAYSGIALHDDSPADFESFKLAFGLHFRSSHYAVWLRDSDVLKTRNEPVGMVSFEPAGLRNAYLHIALSRAVWGQGIGDEAISLAIDYAFDTSPDLTRVSVSMLERNRAAQALARRIGFQFEAVFPDMVLQQGIPCGVVHFGITRRDWQKKAQAHCA
jgi:RimJ/RimL family protein N-acetyltransferase